LRLLKPFFRFTSFFVVFFLLPLQSTIMAFNAPMNVPSHHEMSMMPYMPMWSPMWPSMNFESMMNPMTHQSMNPMTHYGMPMPMSMNTPFEMMPRHHMMMNPVEMMMKNWMRHSLPHEVRDVAFRPMSMVEYNSFANPITFHADGSRTLNLCFDVKGFKPEEIKVEILNKERAIVVEAKHEVKEKEHHVTRHFTRRFVFPEELHIELSKIELKSCLTPEGLLVIESVLPRLTVEELKAIREKPSTKHMMPMMGHSHPMHPMHPMHFNPTVSIPIKMN